MNGGEKPNQKSAAKLPDGMTVKAPTRDISGQRFGRLVAIEVVGKTNRNSLIWRCICDCGNIVDRRSAGLRDGKGVISCGCYLRERGKWHLTKDPWNKGITYANKPDGAVYANRKAWANAVRRERGEACERCEWNEAQCDVHHRMSRHLGGENTIANGIVLCPNCHRVEHTKLADANDNLKYREAAA